MKRLIFLTLCLISYVPRGFSQADLVGDWEHPLPGEDSVAMTQRIRDGASLAAAEAVRHKYGSWRGFDAWAPMTADRVISYLVLGN